VRFTRHAKLERRLTWALGGLAALGVGMLAERGIRAYLARRRTHVAIEIDPIDVVELSSIESFPASDSPAHHSIT